MNYTYYTNNKSPTEPSHRILIMFRWFLLTNKCAHSFKEMHEIPMILYVEPCLKKWKETLVHASLFYVTVKCISHLLIEIPTSAKPIHSRLNITNSECHFFLSLQQNMKCKCITVLSAKQIGKHYWIVILNNSSKTICSTW